MDDIHYSSCHCQHWQMQDYRETVAAVLCMAGNIESLVSHYERHGSDSFENELFEKEMSKDPDWQ